MTATAAPFAAVPPPSARDGCWLVPLLGLVLALRVAVMLASGAGLHVDEAQYWDWSRELQWGYFSKPPLTSVLIAASTAVLGDGLLGVRLWAMACWLLASLVLWRLGVAAGSASGGVWAAVLLAATPASGLLGLVATTDAPLMLAWTLCLAATWHALQGGARATGCWLLAGLALGLGLQAKYTMAAAALSWLWLVLARRNAATARGAALASLVAVLVFSPNLAWNAVHHWPTLRHTAEITEVAEAAAGTHSAWRGLGEFLGTQLLLAGPVVWIVAFAVVLRRRGLPRGPARAPWAFAMAFVLPLATVGVLQSLRGPLQLNWTAPCCPACACCWAWQPRGWACRARRRWRRYAPARCCTAASRWRVRSGAAGRPSVPRRGRVRRPGTSGPACAAGTRCSVRCSRWCRRIRRRCWRRTAAT
jgi:hypothetical protein